MVGRQSSAASALRQHPLRTKLLRDLKGNAMQIIAMILLCFLGTWVFAGLDGSWRNEHMAMIRDAFPDIKVIWRVRFTNMDYSCRTDVKTILCSLCGIGLTDEAGCKPLTYFTELVNLDAGHNNNMRTLSFLRYMPNLEVFITYNNYLRDVDDLVYSKKLKYLELYGSSMHNINAIGELYELTDLQLGYCYNLNELSRMFFPV